MSRAFFKVAILAVHLLLFSPAVLASGVLHESDTSPTVQFPLTFGSAISQVQEQFSSDHSTSDHDGEVLRPNIIFNPLEELRDALDVMQTTWFKVWLGTWPTAIDWTRAVLDTLLISSLNTLSKVVHDQSQYGSDSVDANVVDNEINKYFVQNVAYYFGEDGFGLRNQAYDDMLWVVLGWLESVKFIKYHGEREIVRADHEGPRKGSKRHWHGHQFIEPYAHQAHIFYELASQGWDTDYCSGGMIWNPYLGPYKNAITNELWISASVGMYLHFPGDNNTSPFMINDVEALDLEPAQPFDQIFLDSAIEGYAWLNASGMTNHKGLYTDGWHVSKWKQNGTMCDERENMIYTYNQGVILSGLRGLWESTGDRKYLEDGHRLARDTIKATGWHFNTGTAPDDNQWAGLGRNGVLEDCCDSSGRCNQDAQTFKGIFFHHLTLFCDPLPLKPRVPGKTFCAVKDLAYLHRQSCREYAIWTALNAQAALDSRDEEGKFGMWWGARADVESPPLPEGAFDYFSLDSKEYRPHRGGGDMSWSDAVQRFQNERTLDARGRLRSDASDIRDDRYPTKDDAQMISDLNDRGRGRTVETQGGGVAVLRALVELLSMTEE